MTGEAGDASLPGVFMPVERLRRGLLKSPSTPADLRLARLLTLARRPLAMVSLSEPADLTEPLDGVTRPGVGLLAAGPRRLLKLKVEVMLTVGENTITSCARGLGGGPVG